MKTVSTLFPLATVVGLLATTAAAAPVSRFVFGTYLTPQKIPDYAARLAADSNGNTILAGTRDDFHYRYLHDGGSYSNYYPFVQKLTKNGDQVFMSSLQGAIVNAMAVSAGGSIFVAGSVAESLDVGPIQPTNRALASDPALGFIAQFAPDGTLVYVATLSAVPNAIAVDASGAAYVTGSAGPEFQSSPGAFQGSYVDKPCEFGKPRYCPNAFVAKISPDGSRLVYGTFLGGSGTDNGIGIAVDAAGAAYIAGNTTSNDFPTTRTMKSNGGGSGDVFAAKVDQTGSRILYSLVLGGSASDSAATFVLDSSGAAYIAGTTTSSDFPASGTASNPEYASHAFLLKLNDSGDLLYSTLLGSGGAASAMAWGKDGRVYITIDSLVPDPLGGTVAFLANLENRPPGDCDPRMTLVAIDPESGAIVDHEGLIGFLQPPTMAAGAPGVVHLLGGSTDNSDFVITDGPLQGSDYYPLFVRVDFSKSAIFQPACVANAAGHEHAWAAIPGYAYAPGPFLQNRLVPGEIFAINGKGLGPTTAFQAQPGRPLPYRVEETQVTIDGNPVPLLYVSDTEIRAIVPYSQPNTTAVSLGIQNGDLQFTDLFWSGNSTIYSGDFSACVFTRDNSNLAAALNQDGTANSPDNPAPRGSIVSLFVTGLGPFDSPLPDNQWTSSQPPWPSVIAPISAHIWLSRLEMPILYAGPAPGQSPGVYQVNVQIPDSAPTGNTQFDIDWNLPNGYPLYVSQPGVWIAVK